MFSILKIDFRDRDNEAFFKQQKSILLSTQQGHFMFLIFRAFSWRKIVLALSNLLSNDWFGMLNDTTHWRFNSKNERSYRTRSFILKSSQFFLKKTDE